MAMNNGQIGKVVHLTLQLAGIVALAVVVTFFAGRAPFRAQIDATKTRAYSLSDQTTRLMESLEDDWRIAVIMVDSQADAAMQRQITEVLRRFEESSPHVTVDRIDPSDPTTLGTYESLLNELRERYRGETDAYDAAIETAMASVDELEGYVRSHGLGLDQARQQLAGDPWADQIQQVMVWMGVIEQQCGVARTEAAAASQIDETQPIADYETARSVLHGAMNTWAADIFDLANAYGQWLAQPDLPAALRRVITSPRQRLEALSRSLAAAADPLQQLPRLELASIGRQFGEGEAAIVIGPDGAVVIRGSQIFPRYTRTHSEGIVTFDQRFRGEQLIASAMRSLTVEHMPMVVLMHADDSTLLRPREQQLDLVGMRTVLEASRFEVVEWIAGAGEELPSPAIGQAAVWVVVPPSIVGRALEPSDAEQTLVRTAQGLLNEGAPVLLSMYPSFLHGYGHPDPWQSLTAGLGLEVDTSRVIYERVRLTEDDSSIHRVQALQEFGSHPIGRAMDGQQTYFDLPVPLTLEDSESVTHAIIAAVESKPQRWLESQITRPLDRVELPPEDARLNESAPLVVAVDREHPLDTGRQRVMVVGSGGWMRSNIADVVGSMGGDRVALVNPGNYELLLNGIAWLAEMDDLIAQSPTSLQVARLKGVTPQVRRTWTWLLAAGLPGLALAMGVVVFIVRRR